MEFCLYYQGKLKSRDGAAGKHAIRQSLHSQLKSLSQSDTFRLVFEPDWDGKRAAKEPPMFVERGGKRYWFFVSEHLATYANLSLTLLVPHETTRIIHNGGDLDNRVKTLFDALRVPAADSEIPASDTFDYRDGMYCLLQDDKLINRVTLKSYQDHSPVEADHVRCIIEVETKITRAMWGNLNFV